MRINHRKKRSKSASYADQGANRELAKRIKDGIKRNGWVLNSKRPGKCRRHQTPLAQYDERGLTFACDACWTEVTRFQGLVLRDGVPMAGKEKGKNGRAQQSQTGRGSAADKEVCLRIARGDAP